MSINLDSLKKIAGSDSAPAPTTEPSRSGGGGSMGNQFGYAIQVIGRAMLGSIVWLLFSAFMKYKGLGWLVNDFWAFSIAAAYCIISDIYLRFLVPFQRDVTLGIIGADIFKWILQFIK